MRILMAHNYYREPGGEDASFEAEAEVLATSGHTVVRYTSRNEEIEESNYVRMAADTVWSRRSYSDLSRLLSSERFDVAHFQNVFPRISPSAYYAARKQGIPVVQTLRNYRMMCVNGLLFREGHVCEDCLHSALPLRGVVRACYRNSVAASGVTAGMLGVHSLMGTWRNLVDLYIAPSQFSRSKFVEAGLREDRIVVKPNFVMHDSGPGSGRGRYVLFVGRLSPEKGLDTLLEAWKQVDAPYTLVIAGDGPMAPAVQAIAGEDARVRWVGHVPRARVSDLMGDASLLVFPTRCYETFGRVVVEAFSRGTPVVASRIGAVQELIEEGLTGYHFPTGDATALASVLSEVLADENRLREMRSAARVEFEEKYTADKNRQMLERIYRAAASKAPV